LPIPQQDFYNIPEITLTYKTNFKASERPIVTCLEDACNFFRQVWDDNRIDMVEEGKLLLLNRGNRVIGLCNLSSGGITETVMDIRHVFAAAIKANACQIIVAHNHPSDSLTPSQADRDLTEKLTLGGKLLDVRVLDHLIICRSGFHSIISDESFEDFVAANRPSPKP